MARLLVVEDDPDTVELLRDLFAGAGHRIDVEGSGLRALVLASERSYDLLLLDIDVKDLSGLVVQRAVRDFSEAATIVMSARSASWTAEALRAGATACLVKPFSAAGLVRLVDALLERGGRRKGWPTDVQSLEEDDLRRLRELSGARLDALPFGVIRLDGAGRIREFNAYEARAAGEDAAVVLGMPFAALAPCTKVKAFMGVLEKAKRGERVDDVLRFVFPRHGALALVSVRLYAETEREIWLFVSQRKAEGKPRLSGPG